ncbi:unnamed protein product [Cochlearia groenlandica]
MSFVHDMIPLGGTLLRTRLSYELGGMLDVGGYDGGLRARTDAADDGEGGTKIYRREAQLALFLKVSK